MTETSEPTKKTINPSKLTWEIVIILVAVIGLLFLLLAFLASKSNEEEYTDDKYLYNTVLNYDYSKGRDKDLEQRLDKGVESALSTTPKYYFNLKAKLYYFYRVGNYHLVASNLDELYSYVPSPEESKDIIEMYVKVYARFGNETKVAEYQEQYAAFSGNKLNVEDIILEEDMLTK